MIACLRAYLATRKLLKAGKEIELKLNAREVEITPFFASVNAYTGLAEQISLAQLNELMGAYFDACTEEIQREQGTIDKYVGDAIIAMFGAPIPVADHALHSCVAAVRCQARVTELRTRFQAEGGKWPSYARQLRVRVGLNTGVVVVGNIGSRTRFSYTMLGDEVNLAARLESGAQHYGVWTLCSGATHQACERSAPGRVVFRPLGPIVVKGRLKPVEIFEPVALRENLLEQLRECLALFSAGLARYGESDWPEAIRLFEQSARLEADQPGASPEIKTNPSLVFLEHARSLSAGPNGAPFRSSG